MQCNDRVHKNGSSHRRLHQPKLDSKEQEDLFKYFVSYKPEACAAGQRITTSPAPPAPSSLTKQTCSFDDRRDDSNDSPPEPTATLPTATFVTSRRRKLTDECAPEANSEAEEPKQARTRLRSRNKGESRDLSSRKEDSSISSCSTLSSASHSRPVSPAPSIRSGSRMKKIREGEEWRSESREAVFPAETTPKRAKVYDRPIARGEVIRCVEDEDGMEQEYAIKTVTYVAMVHDDPESPKVKREPLIVTPRKPSRLPIVDINSSIEPLPYRSPLKRVQDLPATPRKIASLCAPSSASSRKSPVDDPPVNGNGEHANGLFEEELDEIVDCPVESDEEVKDTSAIEQLIKSVREDDRNGLIEDEQSTDANDEQFDAAPVDNGEAIVSALSDAEVAESVDILIQDATSKDSIQFAELCDQLNRQRQSSSKTSPTGDAKMQLERIEGKKSVRSDAKVDKNKRPYSTNEQKDNEPNESAESFSEPTPPLTRRLRTRKSVAPMLDKSKRRGPTKRRSPIYKVVCEPARRSLKPILRAANRKSMLARRTLNRSQQRPKKRLQWASSPVTMCVPITPRPGFIAGKVEMPTSPLKMTVRARPDLPIDPGAVLDGDAARDSGDVHDANGANSARRRLSSDDILFAKETAAQSRNTDKRRRSSRRSKELYYRADDSGSQSSTPSEKSDLVPVRTIILRRLSCLPPPKRIVDYDSATDSPSDNDTAEYNTSATLNSSGQLTDVNMNEDTTRQNGSQEQENVQNGDDLASKDNAQDIAPIRRSTRRSSCVYARNRAADVQPVATINQTGEKDAKRPRRLSCYRGEKIVVDGSAANEPKQLSAELSSPKSVPLVEPKVFSIFTSRRRQSCLSIDTHTTNEIDQVEEVVLTTSDAEEKANEDELTTPDLSTAQPLFPLFQRGRRSQMDPAPEPDPPKKRGGRKNVPVGNGDKNNGSATLPPPSQNLRRTRSQSKKLDSDASMKDTKDAKDAPQSVKKPEVRKSAKTKSKPIEEVDLTADAANASASSSQSCSSIVVERVHSRWLGECDCAPFVDLIHLTDSSHPRMATAIESSEAILKMRSTNEVSQEIGAPTWQSRGLMNKSGSKVINGYHQLPLPLPTESLVQQVVDSSFTADQRIVFNRLRSAEIDGSTLVWTEAARPRDASHMLGDTVAIAKVENWLKAWKQRLSSGAKKTNNGGASSDRAGKRGRKRRKSSDDESDYEDEESVANPLVVGGATGVGKTALVYALAEAMGMRVIEMSSNARRATAQLRQTLTGATHTHRVSTSTAADSPLSAFLSPSAVKKPKLTEAPPKTIGQFSVILIDDADILLPDDDGFWTTLKLFAAESRVPIVLTCADELRCLTELRRDNPDAAVESVRLSAPTVQQLSAYLQAVVLSLSAVSVSIDSLQRLCLEYNCDVRRCLLAVQALVVAPGRVPNHGNKDELLKPIDIFPLRQSDGESSLAWLHRSRLNSDAAAFESTERLGRFGVKLLDGLTDAGDALSSLCDLPAQYAACLWSGNDGRDTPTDRPSDSEITVSAVRESLHKSQLCSGLTCVSVDYCSYLAHMAKASQSQQNALRGSRRHQHYFDKTTADGFMIDPDDRLKTAFARAFKSLF